MDSEELEAIEEEEKLVREMVKKGTMQQSNKAEADIAEPNFAEDANEDNQSASASYEKSKLYRKMQGTFFNT